MYKKERKKKKILRFLEQGGGGLSLVVSSAEAAEAGWPGGVFCWKSSQPRLSVRERRAEFDACMGALSVRALGCTYGACTFRDTLGLPLLSAPWSRAPERA